MRKLKLKKSIYLIAMLATALASVTMLALYISDGDINKYSELPSDHQRFPASPGASRSCTELISDFLHPPTHRTLDVHPDSLMGQHPDLLREMRSLRVQEIDYIKLHQQFSQTHRRAPSVEDVLDHIFHYRQDVIDRYQVLLQRLESSEQIEVKNFAQQIAFTLKELRRHRSREDVIAQFHEYKEVGRLDFGEINHPIHLTDEELFPDDLFQFFRNNFNLASFHGEYGELITYSALEYRPLLRGLRFREDLQVSHSDYQSMIVQRVQRFEESLQQMSLDELTDFLSQYPGQLFRLAQDDIRQTPPHQIDHQSLIDRALEILKVKEIDLVFERPDGKIVWAEVKTSLKDFNLKKITTGRNSIENQLRLHREVINVLGLSDDVDLYFISPLSRINREAKDFLESEGIRYIYAPH